MDDDPSAAPGSLDARRAALSPEAKALVRLLTEQIDASIRLRLTRDALGLSQAEAAEIAGVTLGDVSEIESGRPARRLTG